VRTARNRRPTVGGRAHRPASGGWTLLEVVVAALILMLVLAGFSRGLASSTALEHVTRERGQAREAAQAMLEELRDVTFEEVFARYDADPGNDYATGVSPGAHFDVEGLRPRPDDPDGRVGQILFPVSELGELREDLELPRLGMPRDLTGDQFTDDIDHAGDYRLLPVLVRVEWQGVSRCSLELVTVLKRMERVPEEP